MEDIKKEGIDYPEPNPKEVKELLTISTRYLSLKDKEDVDYQGARCMYSKDGQLLLGIYHPDDNGVVRVKPGTKAIRNYLLNNPETKTIILPESIIAIEEGALRDMDVIVECDTPYFTFTNGALYTADMKALLYAAKNAQEVAIPEGVTRIGAAAFYACESLESIVIPDTVTCIGDSAFELCENLESIVIPDLVTDIGKESFESCHSLESVTIGESVKNIGDSAFCGCSVLNSINIPGSVTSIGECAFADCYGLESITIPNSVTSIGEGAFDACESLKSIIIPKGTINKFKPMVYEDQGDLLVEYWE